MKFSKKEAENYGNGRLDEAIEQDVALLRSIESNLPAPEEPHPAYWNNFLIRLHERVDGSMSVGAGRARRRWFSPALIWSSLAGVTALLVVAVATDLIPVFEQSEPLIAEGAGLEAVDISPLNDEDLLGLLDEALPDEVGASASLVDASAEGKHLILTASDLELIDAIEQGDDDAMLMAIIDDEPIEL